MPLKDSFAFPRFVTVEPPLMSCDDELVWFNIANSIAFKPIYENQINYVNYEEDIKRVCTEVFKQTVTLSDQKILNDELEKNPDFVNELKITPLNISSLIECNPLFAYNALEILMKTDLATDYLSAMVNMEMSLNSLEVVNRLTTSSTLEIPSEFLHLYISNCISACEQMTNKFFQKRSVRILCVFLQSLIRKKKLDVSEFSIEIESFCITFNRIKEAIDLYKLCKSS